MLGRSIVPVFFTVTKALVTSPMPWLMSMLVLQPSISRLADWNGAAVNVSVGWRGVNVGEGDGVIVFSGVTAEITVTFVTGVFTKTGGGMMKGVGETIPGVWVGIAVHTGNGCGATPQMSHEVSINANSRKKMILFIFQLYTCGLLKNQESRE